MPIYLMPAKASDDAEADVIISKMGAEVISPSSVHDFVKTSDYSETQFMSVSDDLFTKIMRNVSDLTPDGEMPKVLFGAPGYPASPRFTSEAAAIIAVEWREMEAQFLKSGLTSTTKEEAQDRSVAARKNIGPVTGSDNAKIASKVERLMAAGASHSEMDDDQTE